MSAATPKLLQIMTERYSRHAKNKAACTCTRRGSGKTTRVDRDVVAAYRASGPGWQVKANEALRAYAKAGLGVQLRSIRRRIRRTVAAKGLVTKQPSAVDDPSGRAVKQPHL